MNTNAEDPHTRDINPLNDLPAFCSAQFLRDHLALERSEGMFLPMMLEIHISDEDAVRTNRAYDLLRSQGHGKTDTVADLTQRTYLRTDRKSPPNPRNPP